MASSLSLGAALPVDPLFAWPCPFPGEGGGGAPGRLIGEEPLPAPGAGCLSSFTLSIIPAIWSVEDVSVDFLGMISSLSENMSASFFSFDASFASCSHLAR